MNVALNKSIINVLTTYYEYNIIEYWLPRSKRSVWALEKNKLNGEELILLTHRADIEDFKEGIDIYLKAKKEESTNIKVSIVILSNNDINLQQVNFIKERLTTEGNISIGYIIVNENSVIYYDEEVKDEAVILQNIFNSITSTEVKKKNDKKATATYILIILNILMFFISSFLSGNIFDMNTDVLIKLGAKYNPLIIQGEYYRLIAAMFLHGGLIHIVFNMYALRAIGVFIEREYGKIKFLIIYFLGGILGSYFSFLFSPGVSIGASGAIFALLGAALIYGIKMRKSIGKEFLSNIIQVIAINLFLGVSISNIDNFGHIGGLLGGIITTLIISYMG
jgi:rhomboid protease GluP